MDALLNVIRFIHLPTYYHLLFVSRTTRNVILPTSQDRESRECNHLWVLIHKLPDKEWNWQHICNNPATTWKRIVDNFDMINNRIDICKVDLGRNPNLSIDDLLIRSYEFPNGLPVHFTMKSLASRRDFTMKYIEKRGTPDLHMNLSSNPNITLRYVLDNPSSSWRWYSLSINLGIPIQDIVANDHLPWSWQLVALRKDALDMIANSSKLLELIYDDLYVNQYLTHEIAIKFDINTDNLFDRVPLNILKAEGLYRPDKTAYEYSQICKVVLSAKYPDALAESCCLCRICRSKLRKCKMYPTLRNAISKDIQSYHDVLDDPEFDWNFSAISVIIFEPPNSN